MAMQSKRVASATTERAASASTERGASASTERLWREQLSQLVSAEEMATLSEPWLWDTAAAIAVLWIEVAILVTAADLLPRLPLG